MRKLLAFPLMIGFLVTTQSHAEETTVIGRVLSEKYIDGIEVPCAKNTICTSVWWKWEIEVERTLNGAPISGRISAANLEHGQFTTTSRDRLKAFVIRRIDDEEKRKLLGVDYLLVGKSSVHELFCFRNKPSNIPGENFYFKDDSGGTQFCIEPPKTNQ